jgi:hypothetical protein
MDTHNLTALKALLYEAFSYHLEYGERYAVVNTATRGIVEEYDVSGTLELRNTFETLRARIGAAESYDEVGIIVAEARSLQVNRNFFCPREHILMHQRLVTIQTLALEGVLECEEWSSWGSARKALALWHKRKK